MKTRFGFLLPLVVAAACASPPASAPTPQAPAPAADPSPAPAAPAPPATIEPLTEAPREWQLLDLQEDRVPGTSATRAYRELLAGRSPERTVVVAVIDGGVDTAHVDLRDVLWTNPDETPGNDRDDDGNGYVDDVHGWNFIGGPDGRNVDEETFEVTRLQAACQAGESVPEGTTCEDVATAYEERSQEVEWTLAQVQQIGDALDIIMPILRSQLDGAEPTPENVRGIQSTSQEVVQAKTIFLQLDQAGLPPAEVQEAREAYQDMYDYGLNLSFNPRDIVGDDLDDGSERVYGNADVTGPDASHGTHVAGIIAAERGNGIGIDGIAAGVRLMIVRAIPNGDERDKDVANAIRYAVDEGADIINMSFGKAFSPRKSLVDDAVRYADEHGVLMIHAAGNDGDDIDVVPSFPTRTYEDGGAAADWIEVGAANWDVQSLAATFSNYGQQRVDIFAPGVAILSTVPGNEFDLNDGTSMAAPVVTGVAALLMAYFPDLTAADVKQIVLDSAVRFGDRVVPTPGQGPRVPFGTLSVTGGVVNAYEAVKAAEAR